MQYNMVISSISQTEIIIWSICIGANIAFLMNFVSKNIIGSLVRKVICGAVGSDNAKSLDELSIKKSAFTKYLLFANSDVTAIISVVGNADNLENVQIFISEKNFNKAKSAYGESLNWYMLPVFVVLSVLSSLAMTKIMPILISALGL